jgi:hypothetical protein
MSTRPYRRLVEEDQPVQQQQQSSPEAVKAAQQAQSANALKIKLANDIATLTASIDKKEKEFNDFKANQLNKINLLRKQAAEAGIDLSGNASESKTYRFSKKLYEAMNTNKADELAAAFKVTFDRLDTLSFYLDDKGCLTFARRLLAWINEQGWNDGLNHWEEVEEKIRLLFTNGTVSMSRREISEFIDTFKEVLINNTVFAWIFGNKTTRMMR